ncbi:MAG: hypothetical protein HYV09_30250 [Deltaproteobacteria bacterium]|nr:hypothetical protein [Deltaproteobacteria bacterium]
MSGAERALRACALSLLLCGCGSATPSAVEEETRAIDLDACLRGDASCARAGRVSASEAMLPGSNAVLLDAPASITAPLLGATEASKLRWFALGMYADDPKPPTTCADPRAECVTAGNECTCTTPDTFQYRCFGGTGCYWLDHYGRKLEVTIEGSPPVIVEPGRTWMRVEISTGDVEPPTNARVTVRALEGRFHLVYAVGRWMR